MARFKPELTRPPDFAEFWKRQLAALPEVKATLGEGGDVKYPSVDGKTEVWGWYSAPKSDKRLPAVLSIPAFGGRRGNGPPRHPNAAGMVVGYRGCGDEPWPSDWITRGLDKPENSVFRLHYLNLVQAVRFLQSRPEVDPKRIYLTGGSLGGGMCVVLAGLLGKEIAGFVASLPGMAYYFYKDGTPAESTFKQMEQFVAKNPSDKATILRVLSYTAQVNFAPDVTCEALVSCGGKDALCFPKMVYAVYNHLGGAKEMKYYPEATHGGGPGLKDEWPAATREWFAARLR